MDYLECGIKLPRAGGEVLWVYMESSYSSQQHTAADQYVSNYYLSGWLSSAAFKT